MVPTAPIAASSSPATSTPPPVTVASSSPAQDWLVEASPPTSGARIPHALHGPPLARRHQLPGAPPVRRQHAQAPPSRPRTGVRSSGSASAYSTTSSPAEHTLDPRRRRPARGPPAASSSSTAAQRTTTSAGPAQGRRPATSRAAPGGRSGRRRSQSRGSDGPVTPDHARRTTPVTSSTRGAVVAVVDLHRSGAPLRPQSRSRPRTAWTRTTSPSAASAARHRAGPSTTRASRPAHAVREDTHAAAPGASRPVEHLSPGASIRASARGPARPAGPSSSIVRPRPQRPRGAKSLIMNTAPCGLSTASPPLPSSSVREPRGTRVDDAASSQ